jgi:hypothetical protein
LFFNLKQYEEAILRYEEALPIFQRVFGDQHPTLFRLPTALLLPAEVPNNRIAG